MSSNINEPPLSHVKLRVPRSNSLSNSLNVPKKAIPNRNSMLEYRYMQNSNHLDAYMLNNLLDNLPSSEFDAMYPNEVNSNIMSMSIPDSNYMDLLSHSSNVKHETKNYDNDEWPKQCNYKTKRISYPTSYVGTSRSFKALNSGVPVATVEVNSIDLGVSKAHVDLKHRNSGNSASNLFDPSRGYDSEPNWCDRPIESKDIISKPWNHHDDMTRKWVERGRNNSYRTSLSLNIVKQSSWDEFDDDGAISIKKRQNNREKHRADVVPIEAKEHRTAKVMNKNDEERKEEIRRSSKEFIECKTYFAKVSQEKSDPKEDVSEKTLKKVKKETKTNSSQSSESGSDDVFESPNPKRNPRFTKRRSSSLDALSSNPPFKSNQLANRNRSSVSINDKPEYYEYPKSSLLSHSRNPSGSVANSASTFHKSLGTTPLHTTPKRSSIKKSSIETAKHSSDYDVRDRGRGRNSNGGRDSYRERHRERDSDRGLSDREQRESYTRSSFNRSMSNAEGTPEDKIGETISLYKNVTEFLYNKIHFGAKDGSLSDTAVSLQGLEMSRRRPDQRSPKSETSLNRDRDRFGAGMGKKSSSTSQLSATGKIIQGTTSLFFFYTK